MTRGWVGIAFAFALLAAGPARAGEPDWAAIAELDTVLVVTSDEDGSARETTVWLAVLDGAAYVRTGSSRWGDNAKRTGELELRAAGGSWPFRVEFVEDDAQRARVTQAFREKYGFSDRMVSWMRGARPLIMQLHPRS